MSERQRMHIRLSLDSLDPPVGTVAHGVEDGVAFIGWIGLIAALSNLVDVAVTASETDSRADDDPEHELEGEE